MDSIITSLPSDSGVDISSGSSMSISSISSSSGGSNFVGVTPSDVRTRSGDLSSLNISTLRISSNRSANSKPTVHTDAFAPGAVLKLSRRSIYYSYALYCGNGRVIHSWSNTRTHFRVRIDSLRSLTAAGVTVVDTSDDMDAFCHKVLGGTPLPPTEIVARARHALHCETRDRRCSIVLILHARYGNVLTTMATSLQAIAPLVLQLNGLGTQFSTGEISLGHALGAVLHSMDPKNFSMPKSMMPDQAIDKVLPTKAVLRQKIAQVHTITSLLRSEIAPFLAAWIMIALTKSDPKASTVAVVVALLKRERASLFFSPVAKAFTIVLTSDANLLERLVRERMECGICFTNYSDLPTKLLECSHVLCGTCLTSLRTRVCPYCREPITFERQITTHYKALANETIREEERQQLEANDFDAPPFSISPPPSASAKTDPAVPSSPEQTIRASLALAESIAHFYEGIATSIQREENEKRAAARLASEDVNALEA